jgi:predicted nucleic acid-binding protein
MTGDKVFLDTNILIYAYDSSAGKKREKAKTILEELWNSGLGVISTQVLQEFYMNITQKVPKPLDRKPARQMVRDFLKWDLVFINGEAILDAIEIQSKHGFSFWDSMIIEAALRGEAAFLYSEDLSHGQVIAGMRIENPLS